MTVMKNNNNIKETFQVIVIFVLIFNFSISNAQIFSDDCSLAPIVLANMPSCNNFPYYVVFEDNFEGNSLDLTKWQIQPWGQGVLYGSNNAINQEYNSLDNVEVSNGTCKIIAKKETVIRRAVSWMPDNEILEDGLPNLRTYNYTSSNLWTISENFGYGKYEIRCRLPEGRGFWPAFWTFGGQRWNEIDIFDNTRGNDRFECGPGYDYDGDGESEGCRWGTENIPDFSEWHTFTCKYEFDRIIWQIDNVTIRTKYRFYTATGDEIKCDDNIAINTYFQLQSFPIEKMHLIMNLAIRQNGYDPDENTPFPSIFEIDYVRYSIRSEGEPCNGCLESIEYKSTNELPSVTRAENYIQAGNDVTVLSGQNVVFKAPVIRLLPGFSTESGSYFRAKSENCDWGNFVDVPITFIGSNAVDNYQVFQCSDPIYTIEATGALYYYFRVSNYAGDLIYSISGMPNSNYVWLWNTLGVAEGWYFVHQELSNCSFNDERDYVLYVSYGNCRTPEDYTDFPKRDSVENDQIIIEDELVIYPNPATNEITVFCSLSKISTVIIAIFDANGKEVFYQNNIFFREGINKQTIDVSKLSDGVYILNIFVGGDNKSSVFVKSNQ